VGENKEVGINAFRQKQGENKLEVMSPRKKLQGSLIKLNVKEDEEEDR
jgi:calcineurin-like phosphoesterase